MILEPMNVVHVVYDLQFCSADICLFFLFFFCNGTRGKQDVHVPTFKNSMLPVARNMLSKFSYCKIYYCKDIISKNFTVLLHDFLLATCLDIKSCIAVFFLQDSFLHFEILQEIVFSCKIFFLLQDV